MSAHGGRVSFCKTALDSGASLASVSEALIHRSLETTRGYYKSDDRSLSLAQKAKAEFLGQLKTTDAVQATEGPVLETLDFDDFDFDAFDSFDALEDLESFNPDAGKSTSSSAESKIEEVKTPIIACLLPIVPPEVLLAPSLPFPVAASDVRPPASSSAPVFNFYFGPH